jgi:hypothetical protein
MGALYIADLATIMERVAAALIAALISGQTHQSQSIPQLSSVAVARSMTGEDSCTVVCSEDDRSSVCTGIVPW